MTPQAHPSSVGGVVEARPSSSRITPSVPNCSTWSRVPRAAAQIATTSGTPDEPTEPVTPDHFEAFIDGACSRNGAANAHGGWAVVFSHGREITGSDTPTTNVRMEMTAAIRALQVTPIGSCVTVTTDLLLIPNTMTGLWRAKENQDLWRELRALAKERQVTWKWVRSHSGHPGNERANELAQERAQRAP